VNFDPGHRAARAPGLTIPQRDLWPTFYFPLNDLRENVRGSGHHRSVEYHRQKRKLHDRDQLLKPAFLATSPYLRYGRRLAASLRQRYRW
jgi:hypothetical protein